jgi:hypothetical protein
VPVAESATVPVAVSVTVPVAMSVAVPVAMPLTVPILVANHGSSCLNQTGLWKLLNSPSQNQSKEKSVYCLKHF